QDWSVQPQFNLSFRQQFGVSLYHSDGYELFDGGDFRESSNSVSAYTNRWRAVALNASFGWGTSPNYSPPAGIAPFLGGSQTASVGVTLRPTRAFRVDESYYFSGLMAQTSSLGATSDNSVFSDRLFRTKATLQFSRELSLRLIVDYDSLTPNPRLIQYDQSRQ